MEETGRGDEAVHIADPLISLSQPEPLLTEQSADVTVERQDGWEWRQAPGFSAGRP
jgi:hypothetical protein